MYYESFSEFDVYNLHLNRIQIQIMQRSLALESN